MESSNLLTWELISIIAYLSIGLLFATFLRKQVSFLQRLIIPNAIIAGIIVLLSSQQVIGLVTLSLEDLNLFLYHLLTGVFICLGLRKSTYKHGQGIFTTTVIICKSYTVLALAGIIFTLIWVGILFPRFPPSFSMLPFLGFGFDQISAHNIALQWEPFGFPGAGRAGFSFGVIGLLCAYLVGIIFANWARRRKQRDEQAEPTREALEGIIARDNEKPVGGRLTTAAEGIESFALHLALIGFIFFATYALMNQLSAWMANTGDTGRLLGSILWQFNFVFGALIALVVRKIIDWLDVSYLFDDGLMARAGGAMLDYLIVAAIASIPLIIFYSYWIEVVILSLICCVALLFFIKFVSQKMQPDYPLERAVSTFGLLTGTITAGLALLRMVDPRLETPVAKDLGYASGLSLLLGLPALVLINFPIRGFLTGEPLRYLLITLGLFVGYAALLFLVWFLPARIRAGNESK